MASIFDLSGFGRNWGRNRRGKFSADPFNAQAQGEAFGAPQMSTPDPDPLAGTGGIKAPYTGTPSGGPGGPGYTQGGPGSQPYIGIPSGELGGPGYPNAGYPSPAAPSGTSRGVNVVPQTGAYGASNAQSLSGGNQEWLNNAMAPNGNVPWDFSKNLIGQRGLVNVGGQLVPKVIAQGRPLNDPNNPNYQPGPNGRGFKSEGGPGFSKPNGMEPNDDWYRNYPEGQKYVQERINSIQQQLANGGTYDPNNPFGGGLSPQARKQLEDQLALFQSYLQPR